MPKKVPNRSPKVMAMKPISSELRAPNIARENRS